MFHEIAHLLLHPRRTAFIDLVREKGSVDDDFDGSESQANDLAADTLIPRMHNDYIAHATGPQLIDLADSLGVGVCILAGRKARLTGNYRSVSCLREALDVAKLRSAEESALNC
jgi:HTH-type transcriptional regulator/antitoxin HigA